MASKSLESTKAAFDQWRASKLSQSERIPQYLWDMVEFLRWEYSDYEMRQALGVTPDQINRHCSHPNNDQNSPEIVRSHWNSLELTRTHWNSLELTRTH